MARGRNARSQFTRMGVALVNLVLAGLCVAMVLGYLGRLDQAFDLLSHFRLHMAVMAAALAAIFGWTNALRRAALAACIAAIGFAGTLPHLMSIGNGAAHAATDTAGSAPSLRLLSYNIQAGIGDHDAILETVRTADADILVLPESWSTFRPAGRLLDALEAGYPYRSYCPAATGCSVTLLSRRPLANVRTLDPGLAWPPAVVADVALGNRTFALFGVHLVFPLARKAQLESIRTLSRELADTAGPAVVAGDFNATPWSHTMRAFSPAAGFHTAPGFRSSWPAALGRVGLPIDHVIARGDVVVKEIATLGVEGSDHRPLLATITMKTPEASR